MSRNLKALGLALAAVFAMGALLAQGAQAAVEHTFHSDLNETILTGELHEGVKDKFKVNKSVLVCEKAKFEGTVVGKETKEVTITPTYGSTEKPSGCKDEATGLEAIVHTNHCAYIFTSNTTVSTETPEVQEHGTAHLECATGSEIEITIPGAGLTLHVGEQTPTHGVKYTNAETGGHKEITTHATAKGIKTTCTGNCFLLEGGGKTEKGEYEGTETLKGFEDKKAFGAGTEKTTPAGFEEGAQTNISLSTP
jgi:hypothetical protein